MIFYLDNRIYYVASINKLDGEIAFSDAYVGVDRHIIHNYQWGKRSSIANIVNGYRSNDDQKHHLQIKKGRRTLPSCCAMCWLGAVHFFHPPFAP